MTRVAQSIELKNISWSAGHLTILHNLSLRIPAGQTLALLGPSGCGKSTLLKLLAGLLQPSSGEIWFGDQCVASARHCRAPEARNLGMVFQDYALWPHMSVVQNVAFPLRMRGMKKTAALQQAEAALEQVGLAEFGDRKPALLSGGQQQRVALARALVAKPAILLFDEPLSNLDRALRETLAQTMAQLLRAAAITAVYVTHDREEASTLADRIIHLAQGQIVSVTDLSGETNAISQIC